MKEVLIYTDGAARKNPGPGGYGTILVFGRHERQLSGGFRRTTNNRMEILAALEGLRVLKEPCRVTVHSDSRYLVDAMTKGWLQGWKRRGWARKEEGRLAPLKNVDLWKDMAEAVERHEIEWRWVRGHAGDSFNERCDALATSAADQPGLPPDRGYEEAPGVTGNLGSEERV